jgi:urea transport system substrate-binding protein
MECTASQVSFYLTINPKELKMKKLLQEKKISRRQFIKAGALTTSLIAFPHIWIPKASMASVGQKIDPSKPIKIGVIYSQTGVIGSVEKLQYKVAMMVIDEINNSGGIHGAKLQPIVRDPGSIPENYAKHATELLDQNVNIFWACYTSSSREAILEPIQKGGALLYYTTFYEGRECTPNAIITGSCPNQQVDNSVPWMVKNTGPNTYFVGSNYIYPRTMNKAGKIALGKANGKLLGDQYINLSVTNEAGGGGGVKI